MFQNQEQDRLETYKRILKNSPTVFGAVMKQQEQVRTLSQEECVLAPALNGFVLWVLQEAMKKRYSVFIFWQGTDTLCTAVPVFTVKSCNCLLNADTCAAPVIPCGFHCFIWIWRMHWNISVVEALMSP